DRFSVGGQERAPGVLYILLELGVRYVDGLSIDALMRDYQQRLTLLEPAIAKELRREERQGITAAFQIDGHHVKVKRVLGGLLNTAFNLAFLFIIQQAGKIPQAAFITGRQRLHHGLAQRVGALRRQRGGRIFLGRGPDLGADGRQLLTVLLLVLRKGGFRIQLLGRFKRGQRLVPFFLLVINQAQMIEGLGALRVVGRGAFRRLEFGLGLIQLL